jgi:hypothetical protein
MRATLLAVLSLALPGWVETPVYTRLFTPPRLPAGTYRTYTSPRPIDELARDLQQGAPGSFEPQWVSPGDGFGQSGGYNRWQVARLFGARRVRVARGPRVENGRVIETWTLVSPYPDPELQRLQPGTLLIVLSLR